MFRGLRRGLRKRPEALPVVALAEPQARMAPTRLDIDPPSWRYLSQYDAATLRWAQSNKLAREQGCQVPQCHNYPEHCDRDYGVMGAVPRETWSCTEHRGIDGWTINGGVVTVTRKRSSPCEECTGFCSRGGKIDGPIDTWYCEKSDGR